MKVTTPFKVSAADTNARTIAGRILEFGVAANASTGKVMFEKGSVEPALVKLNLEHQSDRPIGRAIDISLSADQSTMDVTEGVTLGVAEGVIDGVGVTDGVLKTEEPVCVKSYFVLPMVSKVIPLKVFV